MLRQLAKTTLRRQLGSPLAVGGGSFRRMYHERVVDHYNNLRNVGSFDKNDSNVGTGLVGAPACGDVMKFQIKVDEETGKIVDACFKTFGCGSAIASSSVGLEVYVGSDGTRWFYIHSLNKLKYWHKDIACIFLKQERPSIPSQGSLDLNTANGS